MSLILQQRDLILFRELFETKFATMNQVAELCFRGNQETCRKRIEKLRNVGYVATERILYSEPQCVWLSQSGVALVNGRRKSQVAFHPAVATLQHEIAVRDFRAALLVPARERNLTVEACSIDSNALSFKAEGWTLKPDGFLTFLSVRPRHFFFEIDRGTEPIQVLTEKVERYRRAYKRGQFALRFGSLPTEYAKHPFRVLVTFHSNERMKLALLALADRNIHGFVLATTFDRACAGPFEPIWQTPGAHSGSCLPFL